MTVRLGHPEGVRLQAIPAWRTRADSAVHHLARDFANQAWSNSRTVHGHQAHLERVVARIAAGEGGEHPYFAVEEIVSALLDDATGIAAEIGVEVAQRFRPDDVWRAMVTGYTEWATDWAEPDDRP